MEIGFRCSARLRCSLNRATRSIGAYTVTDALGVRASGSPLGFIAWLFLISGLPLLAYARLARPGTLGPYAPWPMFRRCARPLWCLRC